MSLDPVLYLHILYFMLYPYQFFFVFLINFVVLFPKVFGVLGDEYAVMLHLISIYSCNLVLNFVHVVQVASEVDLLLIVYSRIDWSFHDHLLIVL
jgi:hypothetical protein